MADRIDLPSPLRDAIARDLQPVAPLPAPARRLIVIIPVALVLLAASVAIFGLRRDAPQLGISLTWIASALQMALGLVLTAAALRESVPGTTLPRRVLGILIATAMLAIVLMTTLTWMASPTRVARGWVGYVWTVCVAGTIVGALPVMAIAGWLVARAFPLRPRIAGALYGIGAGLIADAGWRLYCHFSDPVHVYGAHTLGIIAAMMIGIASTRRR